MTKQNQTMDERYLYSNYKEKSEILHLANRVQNGMIKTIIVSSVERTPPIHIFKDCNVKFVALSNE